MKRFIQGGLRGLTLVAVAGVVFSGSTICAAEWGNLKGRFVLDGKAPTPAKIDVTKDQDVCGKHNLADETLVVGEKGGVANVIVWVRTKDVAVHPDYTAKANEKVVLDNHNCRFEPHVLVMRNTQKLEVKNTDPVGHNTNAGLSDKPFNVIIPSGSANEMSIDKAETVPAKVTCNIHPWMIGYLLVRPDPYFAVTDKDGNFEIKNLPAGSELEFQVWQEKKGYLDKAKIGGNDAGWTRGRFKKTLKAGDNDLGEIKVSL
jgi:hypothetical protein